MLSSFAPRPVRNASHARVFPRNVADNINATRPAGLSRAGLFWFAGFIQRRSAVHVPEQEPDDPLPRQLPPP
jgi:hypothetical protein